jgi:itaconate CoA-transferase
MALPLEDLLVVSLEQAVAAPLCTCRLADAGARVIKIERPEGDFARGYDDVARGESSYFVWLNRGKESVVLDLASDADKIVLEAIIAKADVLVQNLKPGALARLGFGRERLIAAYPSLIIASISGFGESGPYATRKAYDLLMQAEVGLSSVTGGPDGPARVGVSVVDISAGMNAYEAILEALVSRGKTGRGADIRISMFDAIAEWMTVPLLHHEGGKPPQRIGLAHPSIAPYGVFKTRDGVDILISIQSDREWVVFAREVLGSAALAADIDFITNVKRVARRAETDAAVQKVFSTLDADIINDMLIKHDIAFGRVNDVKALGEHPHMRRITVNTQAGAIQVPAPAKIIVGEDRAYGPVPALGQDTERVKMEFQGATS